MIADDEQPLSLLDQRVRQPLRLLDRGPLRSEVDAVEQPQAGEQPRHVHSRRSDAKCPPIELAVASGQATDHAGAYRDFQHLAIRPNPRRRPAATRVIRPARGPQIGQRQDAAVDPAAEFRQHGKAVRTETVSSGAIQDGLAPEIGFDRLRQADQLGALERVWQISRIRVAAVEFLLDRRIDPGMKVSADFATTVAEHFEQRSIAVRPRGNRVIDGVSRHHAEAVKDPLGHCLMTEVCDLGVNGGGAFQSNSSSVSITAMRCGGSSGEMSGGVEGSAELSGAKAARIASRRLSM